jgi:hypothetical protein
MYAARKKNDTVASLRKSRFWALLTVAANQKGEWQISKGVIVP